MKGIAQWLEHLVIRSQVQTLHPLICVGSQVAERLGNGTGSIPGHAKLCCVLGQGTSPNLPRGNVPVLPVSLSG